MYAQLSFALETLQREAVFMLMARTVRWKPIAKPVFSMEIFLYSIRTTLKSEGSYGFIPSIYQEVDKVYTQCNLFYSEFCSFHIKYKDDKFLL